VKKGLMKKSWFMWICSTDYQNFYSLIFFPN
jgi:hypothetical protein